MRCFTLSAFLSNEGFSNIFSSSYCWAWVSNVWIWFIFYYCRQTLFKLRVFLLLSSSNYTSLDIADDEGLYFPQAEFTSPLQKTPNQYLLSSHKVFHILKKFLIHFKYWCDNNLFLELPCLPHHLCQIAPWSTESPLHILHRFSYFVLNWFVQNS